MHRDVLIIGAGLSGLHLANGLADRGVAFHLVEARDRVGGRILTETVDDGAFDLGPAWFWPGQPRMDKVIRSFGLKVFDQHAAGDLSYEDELGRVQRGRGYASMEGSYRLEGGFGLLVQALANRLPAGSLSLGRAVTGLKFAGSKVIATTAQGNISASNIVLALPPRVAAARLRFDPPLPTPATPSMNGIATWMAGQAKAVAIYDRPFWREAGLSGDAMSRRGPMAEIHDASPAAGGAFALFGFIGVPPSHRRDETALRQALTAQLVRLFGDEAAKPRALLVKDWAHDPLTATALDQAPVESHPAYGLPYALRTLWDQRLIFAGTEVAPTFGGYLEGALEAVEIALGALQHLHKTKPSEVAEPQSWEGTR